MTAKNESSSKQDMNSGLLYLWRGLRDIKPWNFEILDGISVQKVSLGNSHAAVLTTEGAVYMFGDNSLGQLGVGSVETKQDEPVLLEALKDVRVTSVSCGYGHTAVLTDGGDVYCWGDNKSFQCGVDDTDCSSVTQPRKLSFEENLPLGHHLGDSLQNGVLESGRNSARIMQVVCGGQHTVALSRSGDLWAWGTGRALGLLTKMESKTPEIVPFLQNRDVLSIACGASHTVAVVRSLKKDNRFVQRRRGRKPPWDGDSVNANDTTKNDPFTRNLGFQTQTSVEQADPCAICNKQFCSLGFQTSSRSTSQQTQPVTVRKTLQSTSQETSFNDGSDTSESEKSPTQSISMPPSSGSTPTGSESTSTKHRPKTLERVALPLVGPEGTQFTSPPPQSGASVPNSPFMQKMGSFFQRVSSQPMQDMMSSMVTNLKTSINKIGLTEDGDADLMVRKLSPETEQLVALGSLQLEDVKGEDITHQMNIPKSKSSMLSHPLMDEMSEPRRKMSLPDTVDLTRAPFDRSGRRNDDIIVLETEVWSWGDNQYGQLGHGDTLDRSQPCQIKELNNKCVQEVVTTADHNLALTAHSQVYSWGRNDCGQLGHSKPQTSTPIRIKPLGNAPVWSVATGERHSLLLADGSGFCPEIFYAGKLPKGSPNKSKSPDFVDQFTFLRMPWNNLWLKDLTCGADLCAAVGDKNTTGLVATLHEFASTERVFHQLVESIQNRFVKPMLEAGRLMSDVYSADAPPTDQVMEVLSLLDQALSALCTMVAVNHYDLKKVIRGELHLTDMQYISDSPDLVSAFHHYMRCIGNLRVIKGLQLIKDRCAISAVVLTDLGYRSYIHGNAELDTQTLLELPLARVSEYKQLYEKLALGYSVCTPEHAQISRVSQSWKEFKGLTAKERNLADNTRAFWDSMMAEYGEELSKLRTPDRRVHRQGTLFVIDGRKKNRTFALFNDILVYFKRSAVMIYNLETLWVEIIPDSKKMNNGMNLMTPEETITVVGQDRGDWYCAFCDAISHVLRRDSYPDSSAHKQSTSAVSVPTVRHAVHSFTEHTVYKGAKYEGYWSDGKLHGEGRLMWPDGKGFIGKFKHGTFEYGMYALPATAGMPELHIGNWREWKLHGSGEIRYANGDIFKGYFLDGKRYGHGVLTKEDKTQYIGEWTNDKRNGYGVEVRTTEMYMGMWSDDQKHGGGVMVTLDDLYFEGNFNYNNMNGLGLLITEDEMCYEGQFSGGLFSLSGYGKITFPNADYIEGRFQGTFSGGITVNGTLRKAQHNRDTPLLTEYTHDVEHRMVCFGKLGVPSDRKWADIFSECYTILGCGLNQNPGEVATSEIWRKLVASVNSKIDVLDFLAVGELSRDADGSRQQLFRQFGLDDILLKVPDVVERKTELTLRTFHKIRSYLDKAFGCVIHPLGRLMSELIVAFTTTYNGQGLHARLLHYAVGEIRAIVLGIYRLLRLLFPCLPDPAHKLEPLRRTLSHDGSYSITDHSEPVSGTSDHPHGPPLHAMPEEVCVTPESILHPRLMPEVYPTIFNLYALYHTKDDDTYWSRLERWNKKPDIAIMVYLGIESQYWKSDSMDFDTVDPDSPVWKFKGVNSTSYCYTQAVETLQNITTAYSPMEKLQVLKSTFVEITKALGEGDILGQDLLFPIFTFVVLRAKIRQLGAEIHFIEDLMEPGLKTGELGHMITDLTASYHYLKTEDDRNKAFTH